MNEERSKDREIGCYAESIPRGESPACGSRPASVDEVLPFESGRRGVQLSSNHEPQRALGMGSMVPAFHTQAERSLRSCARCGCRLASDQPWHLEKCSPCQLALGEIPTEPPPLPARYPDGRTTRRVRCVCGGWKDRKSAMCRDCRNRRRVA